MKAAAFRVRAPSLALLSRDDCPLSLHAVVMLESGDGEAADSALRKMVLLDTTAIPLDVLSSTERKAVLVLKQHALETVDDKNLSSRCAARRTLKERLDKFVHTPA